MSTTSGREELDAVAARFGVGLEQARRDHLISHLLAAIADIGTDDVVFMGGTSLARTLLTRHRLSEDIDLVALRSRSEVAARIEESVRRGLARSHGRTTWTPPLTATTGSEPAVVRTPDHLAVQVQLIDDPGYRWSTRVIAVEQRFSDARAARLRVPTPAAATAAKLGAWIDRHAPRDLYDLWALAEEGLVDASAVREFVAHGPFGRPPAPWVFQQNVDEDVWRVTLGDQTRLRVTAATALARVRSAWNDAVSPRGGVGPRGGDRAAGSAPGPVPTGLHRHPGDGWVECGDHRHWGLFGAAGLFLVRRGDAGQVTHVAMQHRAVWSDQGGTWGVPGGALAPGETAVVGALREAEEEAGIDPSGVRVVGTHVLDHGPWSYTTIVADVAPGAAVEPTATDPESLEVRWVALDELDGLPLLPAFAAALPDLLAQAQEPADQP